MKIIKQVLASVAAPIFDGCVGGYFKARSKVRTLANQEPERAEKPLVVIIPSYNNARYYKRNLDSVLNQRYENFKVIYIDDCSPDGTGKLVADYLAQCDHKKRVQLIQNSERKGALANLHTAIHACKNEEIIVTIDGDDWFAHIDVLARINREYQEQDAWLTYGSYLSFPWTKKGICMPIAQEVHEKKSYRQSPWVASHTRTFYAWLFKEIKKEDLQEEGSFLAVTWDMAFMFPMLEMAGEKHIRFIPEITYIYNVATPLNDYKVRLAEQHIVEKMLRARPSYCLVDKPGEIV